MKRAIIFLTSIISWALIAQAANPTIASKPSNSKRPNRLNSSHQSIALTRAEIYCWSEGTTELTNAGNQSIDRRKMSIACKCYANTIKEINNFNQLAICIKKHLGIHINKRDENSSTYEQFIIKHLGQNTPESESALKDYYKDKAKEIDKHWGGEPIINHSNSAIKSTQLNQKSETSIEPDIASLPVIPSSISRKRLNRTSNRYLGMVFTEDEFIPAKPARTIPGRAAYYVPPIPGEQRCTSTGGGTSCIDVNRTVCWRNPVQTKCKTVGGSPGYWVPAKAPQYIPAVPARTVTHRRQLTIDCDDQTYDIKNDAKGWKSYWQNSTVSRLAQETCPAISSYPLR